MVHSNQLAAIFYFFIIFVHTISSVVTASQKNHITDLSLDVYNCILKKASYDTYFLSYCKKNNNDTEKMYIPSTCIPTKLAKRKDTLTLLEQTLTNNRTYYFFDIQLAAKKENNVCKLSLYNYAIDTKNIAFVNGTPQIHFFDGTNENGIAIIAKNDLRSDMKKFFCLYLLNALYHRQSKSDRTSRHHVEMPLYIGDGLAEESITSLMLHHEKNTIVFSTTKAKNAPLFQTLPHRLTIANIYQHCLMDSISVDLPYLINMQKIIYLGKRTYLGLTYDHKLYIFWQENDGTIKYCKQKHVSDFIDIAVDNTVKTKRGFKPHIACINSNYELFVGDLLSFAQPTLFFVKKMPHPLNNYTNNYFFRLFYDNGQCIVIYKNMINRDYENVLIIPDNVAFFYLRKIKQLMIVKNDQNKKE